MPLKSNVRSRQVPVAFFRSVQFATAAFVVVLSIDAMLSLVVSPPPVAEQRTAFFVTHGVFHVAVLLISGMGALAVFAFMRRRHPSVQVVLALGICYGFCTVLAGPGMLMLAGIVGVVGWLTLGSLAFALGAALFCKPWQRPAI
jgi:hypothetical protein